MDLIWLGWSLLLLGIWCIVYAGLREKGSRHDMLVVSAWTSLLALTKPLFVPEYWNPPSLFGLAQSTGFDIESFIFCFSIGGLAVVLYELFIPVRHVRIPPGPSSGPACTSSPSTSGCGGRERDPPDALPQEGCGAGPRVRVLRRVLLRRWRVPGPKFRWPCSRSRGFNQGPVSNRTLWYKESPLPIHFP